MDKEGNALIFDPELSKKDRVCVALKCEDARTSHEPTLLPPPHSFPEPSVFLLVLPVRIQQVMLLLHDISDPKLHLVSSGNDEPPLLSA